jgi:hypothetical protein
MSVDGAARNFGGVIDAALHGHGVGAGGDEAQAAGEDGLAASTVAAVVPSPALSAVFLATCCTIFAPMLAKGQASSTSLATVTPSLVTCGLP